MKKLDIKIGDRFGNLCIIKELSNRGKRVFKCKCDCSKITIAPLNHLRNGHTRSCGCLRNYDKNRTHKNCYNCNELRPLGEFYKNKSKYDGLDSVCKKCHHIISTGNYRKQYGNGNFNVDFRYSHYRACAKTRKKLFTLTLNQFMEITSKKCIICGKFSKGKNYSGIDRFNNNLDYTIDNCVPCCDMCNRLKFKHSLEEVILHVSSIYKYQKSIGKDLNLLELKNEIET